MYKQFKLSKVELFSVALAACMASGCQRLPPNEKTFAVHGKVTMAGGGPLPKGTFVYFIPVREGLLHGRGSAGADGAYRASIYKGQEGLVPGEYKVRIGDSEPEGAASTYAGELAKIPEKYRNETTSGLAYTVKAEDNTYDIKLE